MIRDEVLESFEKNRKEPGTPFEEDHFIDYLIANPKYKGAIHNSFEGKRRFFKFWNQIQLDQGICFSFKDRDKNYSLAAFIERIKELQNNPKSSKAALRHQMKYSFEWNITIFMNAILLSAIALTLKWPFIALLVGTLTVYANYKHISFHISEKRYLNELWQKLN